MSGRYDTVRRKKLVKNERLRRSERPMHYLSSRYRHTVWIVFCLGLFFAACYPAAAKIQVGVEDWGLGGAVKTGMWSPLYVELESVGEDFEGWIEVEVRAGQRVRPVFVKQIALVRDTPARHWVYFRAPASSFRSSDFRFSWEVLDARERTVHRSVWRRTVMMPVADTLVVAVHAPNIAGAGLGGLTDQEGDVRVNLRLVSASMLPDRVLGYESADALVWINPDPAKLDGLAQREAFVQYVRQGGHLVLAAGAGWQALTQSFLDELLPAIPVGSITVPRFDPFDPYGPPGGEPNPIVLMRLTEPQGEVLMRHQGQPVIVRRPFGAGQVTLIGFDPTTKPFSDLKDRPRFWTDIMGIESAQASGRRQVAMQNISQPLIRSLNDFPGFKPINFAFVAFFLVGYIVLIGPVDYFVLKRLGKLHWTWVTFPSIAVLSSVLAFWLLSSGRVAGLYTNAVCVVDACAGEKEITGTTFMTMLSPRQTRYSVSLDGVFSGGLVTREFDALEGARIGMGQSRCYVFNSERIERLLVRIWDAQTMEACWRGPAPELPDVELFLEGGRLSGTATNHTADKLQDVVVLFGESAIRLGDLSPGSTGRIQQVRRQSIADYLLELWPQALRHRYYGSYGSTPRRQEADRASRWASLFAYAQRQAGSVNFRRLLVPEDEDIPPVAFDLPARIQLSGRPSKRQAIVLYSVSKSFAGIRLIGEQPESWDLTVVRLRVPVESRRTDGGE